MLIRLGNRAANSVERAGFIDEAGRIRKYIDEALDGVNLRTISAGPTPMIANYPEKCPYCGGTLDPDATELKSDRSLACSYCGSRINPE
jgi:DNA-directed RNA polymerase subunit RPC12/RpoP